MMIPGFPSCRKLCDIDEYEPGGYSEGDQISPVSDQCFFPGNESEASLQDAPQSFRGGCPQESGPALRGGDHHERTDRSVQGVNDGEELEYSLEKLSAYAPVLQSVSVVPVGLTKFRDGLYPLESFEREDAIKVLEQIHRWQRKMYKEHGIHFIHASDEWYILAGLELPEEERYDGYLQLENGVGMLRLLDTEVRLAVEKRTGDEKPRSITVATGKLAAPYIEKCLEKISTKYPNLEYEVITIRNNFFGEKITVSGLITGTDLKEQLSNRKLGERVLIPCNMLRSGENVFLDDLTVDDVSKAIGREIVIVEEDGEDLVSSVLDPVQNKKQTRRQMYEQTSSSNSGQA